MNRDHASQVEVLPLVGRAVDALAGRLAGVLRHLPQPVAAGAAHRVQHHDGHGHDRHADGVHHDRLVGHGGVRLAPADRMPPG